MDPMRKTSKPGMLHVYTGDGKGKTTAAMGLALRASGAGMKILIVQFDKCPDDYNHYMERKILMRMDNIVFIATGINRMLNNGTFRFGIEPGDSDEAKRGLMEAKKSIENGNYGMVILDEAITALSYGLISESDLRSIIDLWKQCGKKSELILTGRGATEWLINEADLVTEMKKIKHYFDKGVKARIGIEF